MRAHSDQISCFGMRMLNDNLGRISGQHTLCNRNAARMIADELRIVSLASFSRISFHSICNG
jgi:hypothetical protein